MKKNQIKLFESVLFKVMYNLRDEITKALEITDYYTVELCGKFLAVVAEMYQADICYAHMEDDEEISFYDLYNEDRLLSTFVHDLYGDSYYNVGCTPETFYDVNKDYNLCTDEEVEGLLKELKEIYDEMFD